MGYPLCQESPPALRERDRVHEIWAISMHVRSICKAICDTGYTGTMTGKFEPISFP
jgi:hypothetical protein